MPTSLFLAHGSPMLAIEQSAYADFLGRLAAELPAPKAVVIFTAHWEEDVTTVSAVSGVYDTIYDFYGFPEALYQVKYPAEGSPELAEALVKLLAEQGIPAETDNRRGLDHGSWTLLSRMYPSPSFPVIQVSVNPALPPREQYRIGEALRGLDDDVLVIGSGVTVHNLRALDFGSKEPHEWAAAFDGWLLDRLAGGDTEGLFDYAEKAPYASRAVPRAEHFVPFFIALGSGDPKRRAETIYRGYQAGNLSYLSLRF